MSVAFAFSWLKKGKNPEDLPGFMHFSVASQFDPISAKTHHSWIITARSNFFTFGEEALYVPRGNVLRHCLLGRPFQLLPGEKLERADILCPLTDQCAQFPEA